MKKLIFLFLSFAFIACNNSNTETKTVAKDSANMAVTNYAYKIDHPDNWEIGSSSNTAIALNALKAWELGKVDESTKYFADSVKVQFDAFDKKMSNDSLKAILKNSRDNYKSITINMKDWESVISKDKSEEWVTLWYTQNWETNKGAKDSASVINDVRIQNGKIIWLSEYSRKLH